MVPLGLGRSAPGARLVPGPSTVQPGGNSADRARAECLEPRGRPWQTSSRYHYAARQPGRIERTLHRHQRIRNRPWANDRWLALHLPGGSGPCVRTVAQVHRSKMTCSDFTRPKCPPAAVAGPGLALAKPRSAETMRFGDPPGCGGRLERRVVRIIRQPRRMKIARGTGQRSPRHPAIGQVRPYAGSRRRPGTSAPTGYVCGKRLKKPHAEAWVIGAMRMSIPAPRSA